MNRCRLFLFSPADRIASEKRWAFTLVELLVVIAIIGILVALLLPAVQAAREASRRIACSNNLHQVGLALHNYNASHGTFPPGTIEYRNAYSFVYRDSGAGRNIAWSALILPFMEQQAVYDQIDFTKAYDSAENAEAAAHLLSVYICPSVPDGNQLHQNRGPCQYGGISGKQSPSLRGIMLYDTPNWVGGRPTGIKPARPIRAADITDGLTNTLVVAEDCMTSDGQWICAGNVMEVAYAVNDDNVSPIDNEIRSFHPGGANSAMSDGSVRFLAETMSRDLIAALCTRADREIVQQ